MVTLAITGTLRAPSPNSSWMANSAAFMLSVSMWVSGNRRSTPPSRRARACCLNAATSSAKLTARKPGSLTSGDSDAVLVVGPIEPATQRTFLSSCSARSAARRATWAAARLMS